VTDAAFGGDEDATRAVSGRGETSEASLRRAGEAAVEALGVHGDDRVLIIHNEPQTQIAGMLAVAASQRADVRVVCFATLERHGQEPPEDVAAAMLDATAVLAPTTFSLSHTRARRSASQAGVRIATLPQITDEIFARAIAVDYSELRRTGSAIAERLTMASGCRITSAAGTDVELVLDGRRGFSDDGDLRAPGAFGNLPAGEAYIAPIESAGDGVMVFDASMAGFGVLDHPLTVKLSRGRLVDAHGPAASALLAALDSGGEFGRSIAEFAVGTNPHALITGNVLEDEKACQTAHIAFGSSNGIGGIQEANVHIDLVMRAPNVELDSVTLLIDGLFP
jgi:leucyl aminopeptidase (aminopeptidase T)